MNPEIPRLFPHGEKVHQQEATNYMIGLTAFPATQRWLSEPKVSDG